MKRSNLPLFPTSSPWRSRLLQSSVVFSVSLFVSGASGAKWGWEYVQDNLAPEISRELSHSLNRPIVIGDVESVSLNSIRFSASSMPAISTDQDTMDIEAVEVTFNPLEFIQNQHLSVDVTLHNAVFWIDEQPEGWIEIEFPDTEDELIEIRTIHLKNASVELVPLPKEPSDDPRLPLEPPTDLRFESINGSVTLADDGSTLDLQLQGQAVTGGQVALSGSAALTDDTARIEVHTDQLAIAPFSVLLPPDLVIQDGTVSSDITIDLQPDTGWQGSGTIDIQNMAARAAGEPNPFKDLSVQIELRDRQLHLHQGEMKFGGIPFQRIEGTIDLETGLDLTAAVDSVNADDFMSTFQLELPFPVTGALMTEQVDVTGSFDHVMFAGRVYNAEPIQFDRVLFPKAQTDFTFDKTNDHLILKDLQFYPEVGGQFTLDADIHLGDDDKGEYDVFLVDAQLAGVPVDQLLQGYEVSIPDMALGNLYAKAHLESFEDNPDLQMEWALQEGQYPVKGVITAANDQLRFTDTQLQIGGGIVTAEGAIANGDWQATIQGTQIALRGLGLEIPGSAEGELNLNGQLTALDLNAIQGDGQLRVNLGSGSVNADLGLTNGTWQAVVASTPIPLNTFDAALPGHLQGRFTLNGSLAELSPQAIAAEGQIQLVDVLTIQDEPLTADLRWLGDRLEIANAGNSALSIDGGVDVDFGDGWTPTLGELALNLSAQQLNLNDIDILPLDALDLQGLLTVNGTVSGTIDQPELLADVDLQQFAVQTIAFDPQLQGQIHYTPAQVNIDIQGDRDQIRVQSMPDDSTAFSLERDRTTIQGNLSAAGQLNATVEALPLEALEEWGQISLLQPLGGDLSATVTADLSTGDRPQAQANFAITQPVIGPLDSTQHPDHQGDRLSGTLLYADDIIHLSDGQIQLSNSAFAVNGQATLSPDLAGNLSVSVEQGQIQDLITAVPSLSTWTPNDLTAESPVPLDLPAIANAQGTFSGEIQIGRSPQGALAAQVNVLGENWQWGDFAIAKVELADSSVDAQQQVTLPISLSGFSYAGSDPLTTDIILSGQWNDAAPTGQIQLAPIPLAFIASMMDLPVAVDGQVGAIATVSGLPTQPEVVGELELLEAQIHDITVPHAKIGFSYGAAGLMLEEWNTLPSAVTAQE